MIAVKNKNPHFLRIFFMQKDIILKFSIILSIKITFQSLLFI